MTLQTKKTKTSNSRRPASEAAIFAAWLEERCEWGEAARQARTPASDLFADYLAWRTRRRGRAMTQTAFGRQLRARGFVATKAPSDGRIVRVGIRIRPATDRLRDQEAGGRAFEAGMIDAWLAERCVWGQAARRGRTPARDLFDDFSAWSRGQGLPAMSQTAFGRHLSARGIRGVKGGDAGRVRRGPIQFRPLGTAVTALDARELAKARRLAAMPAADVMAAFLARAG